MRITGTQDRVWKTTQIPFISCWRSYKLIFVLNSSVFITVTNSLCKLANAVSCIISAEYLSASAPSLSNVAVASETTKVLFCHKSYEFVRLSFNSGSLPRFCPRLAGTWCCTAQSPIYFASFFYSIFVSISSIINSVNTFTSLSMVPFIYLS